MSTVIEAAPGPAIIAAEEKIAVATQLQLTWWRFRKHKVAVASAFVVAFFYLVAVFADFLAVSNPHATEAGRSYIPPQEIHWFDERQLSPLCLCAHGQARHEDVPAGLRARPGRQALPRPCSRTAIPTSSSACSRPTGT